jgi:hypothetical protein
MNTRGREREIAVASNWDRVSLVLTGVGATDGARDGEVEGLTDGLTLGVVVGLTVGAWVGAVDGEFEGAVEGDTLGLAVRAVGAAVGDAVAIAVGDCADTCTLATIRLNHGRVLYDRYSQDTPHTHTPAFHTYRRAGIFRRDVRRHEWVRNERAFRPAAPAARYEWRVCEVVRGFESGLKADFKAHLRPARVLKGALHHQRLLPQQPLPPIQGQGHQLPLLASLVGCHLLEWAGRRQRGCERGRWCGRAGLLALALGHQIELPCGAGKEM